MMMVMVVMLMMKPGVLPHVPLALLRRHPLLLHLETGPPRLPPLCTWGLGEDGEVAVVGEEVLVVVLVVANLGATGETFWTEVEVGAIGTTDLKGINH